MKISTLASKIDCQVVQGMLHQPFTTIEYHTKHVSKGCLFIAIPGFSEDGHDYIPQAIERGATALIVERIPLMPLDHSVPVLKVPDARKALAHAAALFYDNPSEKLNLVGITGTNGKTSISYFLKSIYEASQHSVGVIGTNGLTMNDQLIPIKTTTPTTPDSLDLQKLLHYMKNKNLNQCIMEVSSHALQLKRVDHTTFQTGVFTNLTPDHLELHKNLDSYFMTKAKLFAMTKQFNIVNIDDPYGKKLMDMCKNEQAKLVTYGIHNKADIQATNIHYTLKGTTYTVQTPTEDATIHVHLPGEIYVYNSLAAIAVAYSEGIPIKMIQAGIKHVENIAGRLEMIYEKNDFKVIIDFAHTEDALAETLKIVKPYVKGKLILVFGVYADMSSSGQMKRKNMGKVAAIKADYSVVTLDNPKHFDQQQIIHEITTSMKQHHGKFEAIFDRKQAIQTAIKMSENNDTILITGKGHETTQVIQGEEIPLNEKKIVLEALTEKVM